MNYKSYTGPAGPTEQQSRDNTEALVTVLHTMGFKVRMGKLSEVDPEEVKALGGEDMPAAIVKFTHRKATEEYAFTYDRWGYVSSYAPFQDDLDQASIGKVIDTLVAYRDKK